MISLTCFRTRRRIGAFLDEALPEGRARALVSHLSACAECRGEAARLKRLRSLLRAALRPEPEPDWSSFWPSVLKRLSAEPSRPLTQEPWWHPVWSRPRLALGGALAGLLLLTAALWQSGLWQSGHDLSPWVIVRSVESVQPNSSVMVFSSADSEMTMIWVFGLEKGDDRSLRHPDPMALEWV